jgi:hypothetical protein
MVGAAALHIALLIYVFSGRVGTARNQQLWSATDGWFTYELRLEYPPRFSAGRMSLAVLIKDKEGCLHYFCPILAGLEAADDVQFHRAQLVTGSSPEKTYIRIEAADHGTPVQIAVPLVLGAANWKTVGSPAEPHILPNKSLQPTATAVTPPAAQEIVPAVSVAEH